MKKIFRVLFLIIIISGLMCQKIYALQEFIDDYENENYVQFKDDVIRNSSLNCMELYYGLISGGNKIYEDLKNDYTEIDNANNRITFPSGDYYVQYASHRAEWAYLYYDYGVNYFDDFVHEIDCYMYSSALYGIGFFWVLSNVIKAQRQMAIDLNNFFAICFYYGSGGDEIQFRYCDGISTYQLGYTCNKLQWYYLRITKTDTDIDLEIFSDSGRTILLDSLHYDLTADEKFRYIYACNGYGQSGYTQILTLYAQNYWIGKTEDIYGHEDDGYFYTKEVLNLINGTTVVLLTNSTIPSNDQITVEFSSNNFTWVNHNNIGGYDVLVAGFESVDLRDCNFSSLYMRFNFTDGDADSTPQLYQIRVITSGACGNGTGGNVTITRYLFYPIVLYGICGTLILIAVIAIWERKR